MASIDYPLTDFVLICNDWLELKRGGGVAIYIREKLFYKILATSSSDVFTTAEFLLLEVCVKGFNVLFEIVYYPPAVNYFSSLETVLQSLGSEYSHHIIMGDFNTDLLAFNSTRIRNLLRIIQSTTLHVLPFQATNHINEP